MIYNATSEKDQRADVPSYVKGKKVIDVGGAMHHWLDPKPYACVDIQESDCEVNFQGDINMPLVWDEVSDYVDAYGKFDFAVCTHVLEDIRNPPIVLEMLPLIAKEGFISMPNKMWELGYVENTIPAHYIPAGVAPGFNGHTYRGFHHHRWICTLKGETLWLFPKLNFIEFMVGLPWLPKNERDTRDSNFHELSFWWKDDIPYKIVNDDFLGPNPNAVFSYYRSELEEGI
jgi:2-polyprenyl-3-methyl-5-hydroxy-6-metoxy-1,4-benzoquinol methylase